MCAVDPSGCGKAVAANFISVPGSICRRPAAAHPHASAGIVGDQVDGTGLLQRAGVKGNHPGRIGAAISPQARPRRVNGASGFEQRGTIMLNRGIKSDDTTAAMPAGTWVGCGDGCGSAKQLLPSCQVQGMQAVKDVSRRILGHRLNIDGVAGAVNNLCCRDSILTDISAWET